MEIWQKLLLAIPAIWVLGYGAGVAIRGFQVWLHRNEGDSFDASLHRWGYVGEKRRGR